MNKKTRTLLSRIALLVAIVVVMACVLSSCGSNTVIDTKTTAEEWAQKEVNIAPEKNWLGYILSWIGIFLGWITKIMPANSYILTLFIFAIIMEIVLIPFSVKQHKNSIRQAKLKPYEMAIRKKYAGRNDQATQQKVTAEIQELYQKENFNPMSGCLPLLIQLPILIVLYWIVVDPIQYVLGGSSELTSVLHSYITSSVEQGGLGLALKSANGSIEVLSRVKELGIEAFEGIKTYCLNGEAVFAEVEKIASADLNFNIGALNFGVTPAFDFSSVNAWLLLIPVITFVVYFFSMRINRKLQFQPTQSADDRQQAYSNNMMDFTMPLMSVWMTFIMPAAVGVYWIFKSIVGVG
ncbi:MAG: membrane protein insertase YidC [Clostridia bacterium]|nr:membrane protein insertase YidC [Clostridia bacterium]